MNQPKSIAVIGGGVIGLCTAYYALRKGHRVTLIERGPADHDSCVIGSAGMIVPSHFVPLAAPGMVATGLRMMANSASPFYIRPRLDAGLLRWGWRFWRAATAAHVERAAPLLRDLSLASRLCFEELESALPGGFGLVKKGLLMFCKTERALEEEAHGARMANRLGIPAEILDPTQAARLEPAIRLNVAGAVYFPQDCHLPPERFLAALARALEKGGAKFLWSTEVTGWSLAGVRRASARADGRIVAVQTTRGPVSADEYVLASGAWSANILKPLKLRLPLEAGKGYSLTLPNPKALPQICSILAEARVAVTPMGPSLRFGGTMEMAGLDQTINPRRVEGIIQSISKYFPEFGPEDFQDIKPWCGLRPCSPDGLPYLGRFARYANLSVATGHGMMGLSLGPITGKLMAQILSDEAPAIELRYLRPDR